MKHYGKGQPSLAESHLWLKHNTTFKRSKYPTKRTECKIQKVAKCKTTEHPPIDNESRVAPVLYFLPKKQMKQPKTALLT